MLKKPEPTCYLPNFKDVQPKICGLYFNDGKRKIDFVLVYKEQGVLNDSEIMKEHRRKMFETNLGLEGLELEKTRQEEDFRGNIYVKVHAPFNTLCKYAQLLNIKMPIKKDQFKVQKTKRWWAPLQNIFKLPVQYKPNDRNYFTCVFNKDYIEKFLISDTDTFFDNAKRSKIVYEILSRCKYDIQIDKFGIAKLISSGAYITAFPLHDGPIHLTTKIIKNFRQDFSMHSFIGLQETPPYKCTNVSKMTTSNHNARQVLYELWSNPRMFYKEQPISLVRKYFGEKVAMYFAWLGFYTAMLLPAAILGVLCFIYGLATMNRDVSIHEICDGKGVGNLTMCPLCNEACDFWKLKDSCTYSKLTYLFDNPASIAFSLFMSLWATFFLEFWKRKQNELAWNWDTKECEQEEIVRPEYETHVKTMRKNPFTNVLEPYLPRYNRFLRLMGVTVAVFTFLLIAIGMVLGVIIYRLSVLSVLRFKGGKIVSQNAKLMTKISAALLNLVAILILNRIYVRAATYLTDLECPRTRSDYEDSFAVKMFLFQFVNYYSSLIYIAFFKGRHSGNPTDASAKLFGYEMEPCDPAGCMADLFVQFTVIMIGKQIVNNIRELLFPVISNAWRISVLRVAPIRTLKNIVRTKCFRRNLDPIPPRAGIIAEYGNNIPAKSATLQQYQEDFSLKDPRPMELFSQYLEMVIQFGFTTMFAAAFPLAPLFSLLNNVIETRLDAYKYVTQFRRGVSYRAQDIGVWDGIIKVIAKLAVLTNAMIIVFTSDFIPKFVYKYHFSRYESLSTSTSSAHYNNLTPERLSFTLEGYINESLSSFNLDLLEPPHRLSNGTFTGSYVAANKQYTPYCRYREYRIHVPPYSRNYRYWVILVSRLTFIIVFQNLVFFVTEVLAYLIPDMSYALKVHLARQRLLLRGVLYDNDVIDERNPDKNVVREMNSSIFTPKTTNSSTT